MSDKKKKWIKIVLPILIAIILVIIAILLLIDPIAKVSAEKIAPLILGVDVKLESIHISPFKGRVELNNFFMGNPDGYASDHSIKMGEVIAEVKPLSLFSQKIHLVELKLKDINVNFETNVVTSNIQDILNSLKQEDSQKQASNSDSNQEKTEKVKQKRFEVDSIEFDNIGLSVLAKGVSTGVPIKVSMDPIGPFGKNDDGISAIGLSTHIIATILTTSLKNSGNAIGDAGKGIGQAVENAGVSIGVSIKNFFSSDNEKKDDEIKR